MTRRRLLEILVALAVLVLLVAVFLVRPTARRTEPPPVPLFHLVSGALPVFTDDGPERLAAASPDRSRTAVLHPVEFEEAADLYVLAGSGEGVHFTLTDSMAKTLTAKAVGWLDDRTIWIILGYRWGTVSPGGDLHSVDPATGHGRLLWANPESGRIQAVDAAPTADGRGIVVRLKAFDEQYMAARDSTVTLPWAGWDRPEPTPGR